MQHQALFSRSIRALGYALGSLVLGCGASQTGRSLVPDLTPIRREAAASVDREVVGRWLLRELVSPGGSTAYAEKARKQLNSFKAQGMYSSLAIALDDGLHGRVRSAGDSFVRAFLEARESSSELAPLIAWFALRQAVQLRRDTKELYHRHQAELEDAIRLPKNIGWRARVQLVSWRGAEERVNARSLADKTAAKAQGCVSKLRLLGPFGTGQRSDVIREFDAERMHPLPNFLPRELLASEAPRALKTDSAGCVIFADEPVADGVFLAEGFVQLEKAADVILAVEGAYKVWVDDATVQERDPRKWARWPHWGVALRLTPGRHRILAKLQRSSTAFRLMHLDGTPLSFLSQTNTSEPYPLEKPQLLPDPNLLSHFTSDTGVVPPEDDIVRFLAADTANTEGQGDIATLLIEPLIADRQRATGTALLWAAGFVNNDPLFGGSMASDLVKNLEKMAERSDPRLFAPRLARALADGEQRGAAEAVSGLRKLTAEFPEVSVLWSALQRTYGELGWTTEQAALTHEMVERFPDNPDVLAAAVETYEEEGETKRAEQLVSRIVSVDKDNEINLRRALERQDFVSARAELLRLQRLHPAQSEYRGRMYDLRVGSGEENETTQKLEADLAHSPLDPAKRLALADAKLAKNQPKALTQAVIDATLAGADTGPILDAIDLTEGTSELEPYRLSGPAIIADYEKQNQHQPGTAARVLDYSAVWVRSDGSARMLEHEIVRIQSSEAIQQFAESNKLDGLVLHMRVIKKDGRIFEPENVQGKTTVTFPHLEVGDYIETEHISNLPSQDRTGDRYLGPRWFFREENIAYARSEFLVVSPKNRRLVVETRGQVPKPEVVDLGAVELRRWRVDRSPAAPAEPHRGAVEEFLPSVYVGWGISVEQRLLEMSRELTPMFPVDPRIRAIAAKIVGKASQGTERERVQALYRWVLDNVQPGEVADGRQVIITREGNPWRAFMELCRVLGIEVDFALVKNRLAAEPLGLLSQASEFSDPALRVKTAAGEDWLWLNSKYASFGFLPDENRGMPAYLLSASGLVKTKTPTAGLHDGVTYRGNGVLRSDGSASLELEVAYEGANAIGLRQAVAEVPQARLKSTLESELFGQLIEGARLKSIKILNGTQFNLPLKFQVSLEVPHFAHVDGHTLSIAPPFISRLNSYASLPIRETPLIIEQGISQVVDLSLTLPRGSANIFVPPARTLTDGSRRIERTDRSEGQVLHLSRKVLARADRVTPQAYHQFENFARLGDAALSANIRFEVGH